MLGHGLVFSAEHFRHLKVPECKEEVAIVPEAFTYANTDNVQ